MIKAAILCVLLASVFAEEAATGGAKDAVGKGYGGGYGGHDGGYGGRDGGYGGHHGGYGNHGPQYGNQYDHHHGYRPPFYRPPFYGPPNFRQRSFDSHYCSVHASFALALSRDSNNDEGYGGNGNDNGYGGNGYGNDYNDRSRHFTRQFCRYAAAHSKNSCSYCCQVAARASNTSPDDITSAIFSFDPTNPTAFGAGADDHKDDGHHDGPYRQKRDAEGGRIRQCVCCAPKRD